MNIVPIPVKENAKQEQNFTQSIDDLKEVMRELVLVEKMTGRAGLPQRVYLAFSGVLMCAARLAEVDI